MSPLGTGSNPQSTIVRVPLEEVASRPSSEASRQRYSGLPCNRFAIRSGSTAQENARCVKVLDEEKREAPDVGFGRWPVHFCHVLSAILPFYFG